ncbi:hypothetical protein [Chryseolinea lacunae]|uniref:Phage major capsid protein n=1 Tax=Chryseolinea lacunae TaxID=2801331 RepID=A0ABS1L1K0_9BACT|nr:hypothetical protein [Chryseolinea lacunae]MBL0745589.1 hypothetical protein [Chryseolinea lacunae]
MASQKGIIKLEGTVGDLSFFKTKDGFQARQSSGINGDRIRNDPEFARTRENGQEFGRAGTAGKLLRQAFRVVLKDATDSRMSNRLTATMMKVLQADATSDRGQRNVIDGEVGFLQGFDFNIAAKLTTTFFPEFVATIDRAAGKLSIAIPEFTPGSDVVAPEGSTHCRLVSAAAEIDFEAGEAVTAMAESVDVKLGPTKQAAFTLDNNVTAASTKPLFLLLGITFYQSVNNKLYALQNGAFNALTIVKADGGVAPVAPPVVAA